MAISPQRLAISLSHIALRYERMTLSGLHTGYLLTQVVGATDQSPEISNSLTALRKHLGEHNLTTENYFSGMLLVQSVSEVENYLVDVLKVILTQFPKKLGSTEFKLADIIDKERDDLILMAADNLLNKLMYLRPKEYLKDFCSLVSIDASRIEPHWPAFIEAKARRDLGIHNNWKINATYKRKLFEAGISSVPAADQHGFLFANFDYLRDAISSCDLVVRAIRDSIEVKFPFEEPGTSVGA